MPRLSRRDILTGGAAVAGLAMVPGSASAAVTAYMQAIAESAAADREIAAFYRETGFQPIWTGRSDGDQSRRRAFLEALTGTEIHGLPSRRYRPDQLVAQFGAVQSERDLGKLEVELSRVYLQYARDMQTGAITPRSADSQIVREVPYRDRTALLRELGTSSPTGAVDGLTPQTGEYRALLKEKLRLEEVVRRGGWGPEVPERKLERGDSGGAIVDLRNRLIRMGYMRRTASAEYGDRMMRAVGAFQSDHGLTPDGVAGVSTLQEINRSARERLSQILVAMERERWLNFEGGRGKRHVYVNLTDFRTKLLDDGKVTFQTKSVVGQSLIDKRTPEFSDKMEHMEINPDWTVPRTILGRDYLPVWRQNPHAKGYLQIIDRRGRVVPRQYVDFWSYNHKNFPYTVRQAPGPRNALGTVKFMFPNPYAIYLHDTPDRHLFEREVRDYSSGCIRLYRPHDFAYVLLQRQMADPQPYFQNILSSGQQTKVMLDEPFPVHIDYRTAFSVPKERMQYRRDIYGRDERIWTALSAAGVTLA
ncbi:MAG: L,D-transpeptidase family protein [Pseudomonadota bacterium]